MYEWFLIWILIIEAPNGQIREIKQERQAVNEEHCAVAAKFKQTELEPNLGQIVDYSYGTYSYGAEGKLIGITISCEPRQSGKWTTIK